MSLTADSPLNKSRDAWRILAAVLTFAFAAGCAPNRSTESTRLEPGVIEVVTDPERVQYAIAFAARLERENFWDQFQWIQSLTPDDLDLYPEFARARLRHIVDQKSKPDTERVAAAGLLIDFGDSDAWQCIEQVLADPEANEQAVRNALWEVLDKAPENIPLSIVTHVQRSLTSESELVREVAIQTAVHLGATPLLEALWAMLPSATLEDKVLILEELARIQPDARILEEISPVDQSVLDLDQLGSILRILAENAPPSLRSDALNAMEQLLRKDLADGPPYSARNVDATTAPEFFEHFIGSSSSDTDESSTSRMMKWPISELYRFFVEKAEPESLPFLRELLEQKSMGRFHGPILVSLARIEGNAVWDEAIAAMDSKELCRHACDAISILAAGKEDETLTTSIFDAAAAYERRLTPFANAILAVGGPKADKQAHQIAARMGATERLDLLSKIEGKTPIQCIDGLVDTNFLDQANAARAKEHLMEHGLGAYSAVIRALVDAGIAASMWDAYYYDEFIRQLGELRPEAFHPEGVSKFSHYRFSLETEGADDYAMTTQFVHDERLYRFGCEDFEDELDEGPIVNAVNRALADAGRPERLMEFGDPEGPGSGEFVIVDPAVARAAEERGLLSFVRDRADMD